MDQVEVAEIPELKVFKSEEVKKEVFLKSLELTLASFEDEIGEEGSTRVVEFLVDSHYGINIPKIFCEMFSLDKCLEPYDDWYHEEFDEVLSDATEDLQIIAKEFLSANPHVSLTVGYEEHSGDIAVIMYLNA